MTGFRQRAFAATVAAVAAASPMAAAGQAQYTVVGAVANESVTINNHASGSDSQTSTGLSTASATAGDVTGSATAAGGEGSASAMLRQGSGPGSGGGLGGPGLGGGGGTATGNASAVVTYQYVFTAKNPGEVFSIINNPIFTPKSCSTSPGQPTCSTGNLLSGPTYYIPDATRITGDYRIDTSGYAYGSVSASGSGPDDISSFSTMCGYSRSSGVNCDGFSSSGSFSIVGVLAVNNASLAANSFFGSIKLTAGATMLEGGYASAFIDPTVAFALAGVDPNDFTLTLSPGFTAGDVATPSVPEPASWALMILGFGAAGLAMRRRSGGLAARAA